ncbi:PREDICTED: lysozyme C, milk isozyme-like [Cyprinodon variegatus]|uniref:lysozyme C, milk isozyme-like n=1 Tax=Cyprinodon variegatus TaxID=28743 RepID=UPI000742851B|nr:PREDICTED: lysozyme C, milk isozyme-like [Cyprinodon variegatus]
MKVLVLFTFAVLGCSLAGARIVSKCELRDKLKEMFESLPTMRDTGMEKGRFLAKVVCHVEQRSGFNTSAVTEKAINNAQAAQMFGDDEVTLYGLFQFPEGLVCSSDSKSKPNMCNLACEELTDDNISDDIKCVGKLFTLMMKKAFMMEKPEKLFKVLKNLIDDDCHDVQDYFSDC